MADEPIYCPFCGARLAEESGAFAVHLDDSDPCREGYATWDPLELDRQTPGDAGPLSSARVGVWTLMAVIVVYSLVIAQQILVGVIAAALVYVAYRLLLEFS